MPAPDAAPAGGVEWEWLNPKLEARRSGNSRPRKAVDYLEPALTAISRVTSKPAPNWAPRHPTRNSAAGITRASSSGHA
jgi:hypothetical protein